MSKGRDSPDQVITGERAGRAVGVEEDARGADAGFVFVDRWVGRRPESGDRKPERGFAFLLILILIRDWLEREQEQEQKQGGERISRRDIPTSFRFPSLRLGLSTTGRWP
jgi:hypothetical protein